MADIVRKWDGDKTAVGSGLQVSHFLLFEKCHEARDTHAPICLDSWQLIFGVVFESLYQRWSWAMFSLAVRFLHLINCCIEAFFWSARGLASGEHRRFCKICDG